MSRDPPSLAPGLEVARSRERPHVESSIQRRQQNLQAVSCRQLTDGCDDVVTAEEEVILGGRSRGGKDD